AVRPLRGPRPRARAVSLEPAGRHRPRQGHRRVDGRQGEAAGEPPAPAGGRHVLLLAPGEPARDEPGRVLGGQPHGRHEPAAPGEDGAVLARPLRHERGQGPRLPEDARPARALPDAGDGELPRAARGHRPGSGHAGLSRRRRERQGRAQRELRARDHGAVHHGGRQLLGSRHPEVARAFTGWNFKDLAFVVDEGRHDDAPKTVLGRTGRFDGVGVIDIILDHPATADFIAAKIYRYFVREEVSPALQRQLGSILRDSRYEIAPLLRTIFLSKDFYSPASYATHIKGPVELVVSTCRKLGLGEVPGVPDFNEATSALGQQLLRPPTVAGWAQG